MTAARDDDFMALPGMEADSLGKCLVERLTKRLLEVRA